MLYHRRLARLLSVSYTHLERLDAAKVVVSGNYAALLIVGISPENGETEVDFSSDVSMAENAFYSAIG